MKSIFKLPLLLILLSGCSLTPDYQRPAVETPARWRAVSDETAPAFIAQNWWTNFQSAELNSLMDEALAQNLDLRASLARIEQSRAAVKISGASLLPAAGATAGATRSFTDPAEGRSNAATALRAGMDISYELDLFGANRASLAAAQSGFDATRYTHESLALVIMGDVANNYFQLLNLRERLAVADSNLANARETLRIMRARVREGAESDLELAQQETAVATSEAGRATLIQQSATTENALAILLGRAPQDLGLTAKDLTGLPVPPIDPAQPSALLERRPDIRAAEAGLIAANANIGVARAAFFPQISIGLGQSLSAAGLGDPVGTALSLASSLTAPLFQGGRLEGGVEQATARQQELIENYRKTILTAFQEVEDALAAVRAAEAREKSLQTATEQARKSYRLSRSRYDAGAIDFQTLLTTQNSLLSAEDNYSQARLARLNAATALFKALGGGWRGGVE